MMNGRKTFEQLTSILRDEDLKAIIESSREFRRRFTLR